MNTRTFLTIASLLVAATAATSANAAVPTSCGTSPQFKVKTSRGSVPALETGKAQIVFIEQLDGDFGADPISRVAVDGAWVGANKGDSFFAIAVDPGTHKVCVNRQTSIKAEAEEIGIDTVDAQAGHTYYLSFDITRTEVGAAQRANGGAGGFGGTSGAGTTPDMTAKRKDTIDSSSFSALTADQANRRLAKSSLATSIQK